MVEGLRGAEAEGARAEKALGALITAVVEVVVAAQAEATAGRRPRGLHAPDPCPQITPQALAAL